MRILVTGVAGFIGYHVAAFLLKRGDEVVGVDNLNEYYDVRIKKDRLGQLEQSPNFSFVRGDLSDAAAVESLFSGHLFDRVIHLAAQAGVRYSLTHPEAYIQSNLVAFSHILEACRHKKVPHLVYASSSSVYGLNTQMPFSVRHSADHPVSLYAATKKSNELMAHSYSHLFGLPTTGLRFFTVYGPWGRPDMALFKFVKAIEQGQPIDVYHQGKMKRDFTYIDDIVQGVVRVTDRIATENSHWSGENPDPGTSSAPYRLYNIGNHQPVFLTEFIEAIEKSLGKRAQMRFLPIQPGDVMATYADIEDLKQDVDFVPQTPLATGIEKFVQWYRTYYMGSRGFS